MPATLLLEQSLNGIQFGLMLFLLAAGLTLVFGIMDMINLAHGSLYMIGAYLMASLAQATGSFWVALPLALVATAIVGALLEISLLRRLYERDHLTQVLATFAVVVIVIGGIGSIRGAFVGALLVGLVDTMGRALLPIAFARMFSPQVASNLGPSLSSILIYVLMAAVLFLRPQGLFPA